MYCAKSTQSCEEIIKKSRFIGVISPCETEQAALMILKDLHTQHPHANHIAFAYRIQSPKGLVCRFHDAGEPKSTAGKPIFQHLEGKQLINVLVAVIRYFGGVKLGAGGLTRAYGNSAKQVIEGAEIIEYVELSTVALKIDYNQMRLLNYHLPKLNAAIIAQDFTDTVSLRIRLPSDNISSLQALF